MNSIQHFAVKGIENLYDITNRFLQNPSDFAGFTKQLQDEILKLGLGIIRDSLELMDEKLRENPKRKKKFDIIKKDPRTIITSLGSVQYQRTYFRNKETGEESYLVDEQAGLESRERLTEDAEVRLLREVVSGSYQKSGEQVCLNGERVSRQTVKNVIHGLEFPAEEKPAERKQVKYLYIEADEDHVALQYLAKKGDVARTDGKYKNNCLINKIVYVYEGIETDGLRSKRHRLINVHYFCGSYAGGDNEKLWKEVEAYIREHYDVEKIEKIYLNADGGSWIQAGKEILGGITMVLDEFHLSKYLVSMTHFLGDSSEDARREIKESIKSGKKEEFEKVSRKITGYAENENDRKRIEQGRTYILNNWQAAVVRYTERKTIKGCSAEGHVSHVLSSRMSSRPMGWSRIGADRMAKLLAYVWNKGDLLKLVRYQDRGMELKMAAGAEEMYGYSASEALMIERQMYRPNGAYYDKIQAVMSYQGLKQAAIGLSCWI